MSCKERIIIILIAAAGLATAVAGQGKTTPSFRLQEIKLEGRDVALAGTLVTPKLENGARVPTVLLFADGDAPATGRTIYGELAERLAGRGWAVLRFDRRCVGASECKAPESFDDYVDDGRQIIGSLSKHPGVDPAQVFLFGHGEGALTVASIAAHSDQKFAGVILAAVAGRTLNKILRDQIQARLTEAGKPSDEINAALMKFDRVAKTMMGGQNTFPDEKLDGKNLTDAILIDLIKRYHVVISQLVNDPLQIVNAIESPVLIIQGRKDARIAVKDAQFIEEALKRAYHPDTTLQLFDDVDHLLRTHKGAASFAAEGSSSGPLDPGVAKTISDWIQQRVKKS